MSPKKRERTALNVQCRKCRHRWTAAYLPMPMASAAALLRGVRCPMCAANSRHIFIDTGEAAGGVDARSR
jgi:DNA-directed RNA polymerase subunit RPC12/RpoP